MSFPVRVTAQIMGATVFNTKNATLEWTPQGTIRITQTEPGQQPLVVLDTPAQGLAGVSEYTTGQDMLVFKPVQGPKIKLSLMGSMLAPEWNESADAYARRQATVGVPPRSWWAESLAAQGVKITKWGWGKSFAIAGGIVVGAIAIGIIIALASGAFS